MEDIAERAHIFEMIEMVIVGINDVMKEFPHPIVHSSWEHMSLCQPAFVSREKQCLLITLVYLFLGRMA